MTIAFSSNAALVPGFRGAKKHQIACRDANVLNSGSSFRHLCGERDRQ
jgi:hypothetical protein